VFAEEGELVGDNTFELLAHIDVEVPHRIAVDGALGSLRSVTERGLSRGDAVGIANAKENWATQVRCSSARDGVVPGQSGQPILRPTASFTEIGTWNRPSMA